MQDNSTKTLVKLYEKAISFDHVLTAAVKNGSKPENMLLDYLNDDLLDYYKPKSWKAVNDEDYADIEKEIREYGIMVAPTLADKCGFITDDGQVAAYFTGWAENSGYDEKSHDIAFYAFVPKVIVFAATPEGFCHEVVKASPERNGVYCIIYDKNLTEDKELASIKYFSEWLKNHPYDKATQGMTFRPFKTNRVNIGDFGYKVLKISDKFSGEHCIIYDKTKPLNGQSRKS